MDDNIYKLDSIDAYNRLYGLETLHPLVSVVNLNNATRAVPHICMRYGIYALYIKFETSCDIKYGRSRYDYQEGTIVCFAPGQVIETTTPSTKIQHNVYGLLFHPDLIRNTHLATTIKNYSFFSYSTNEALHLSDTERDVIMNCLKIISTELEHAIDKHSKTLIASNIELLLNYCMRFYDRQFETRTKANSDVLARFEQLLNDYFYGNLPEENGLPSVKYFADKICLSPNYFGDMIKKETGLTAQEYIQSKIIELAKERISSTSDTISSIAYSLGFQYPQHLCRMFKKHVGCTPNEYRSHFNS